MTHPVPLLWVLILFLPAAVPGQVTGNRDTNAAHEPATVGRSGSDKQGKQTDPAAVVRAIVDQTNAFRKEHKRPAVKADASLTKAAQYFANHMARTGKYGHTADGRQPAERAAAHRYAFCIVLENIAYQYSSAGFETKALADKLYTGWRESPGHRKNMLDPDALHTGVAVAQAANGTWYAVQMFGRPESAKVEFKLTNAGERAVRYTVGEERFTLEPRWTRTHTRCRPADVVFTAGEQDRRANRNGDGARGETVRPKNGITYEVTADASGKVRVRPTK